MNTLSGNVGVFLRIRPTANFAQDLVECLPDGQTVNIYRRRFKKTHNFLKDQHNFCSFRLEGVLQDTSQEEAYDRVCRSVVRGALDGYNGTVMCFGQTGSGKTFTMTGSTETYMQRGFIPRALQEVFEEIEKKSEFSFSVQVSFMEIYNETVLDLLSPRKDSSSLSARAKVMEVPGRGVVINGLSLHPVFSEENALNLMFEGEINRVTGSHALNSNSSRSHCIFTIHMESRAQTSDAKYITSKLNLVDLAGSERVEKTESEGKMMKEAMYINKSLSFLEQTILALADHRRDHIPFRQTKLTHVLKDSLGGNCNTVLVANVFGEAAHINETLCTLHFARRMKNVKTQPVINVHIEPAVQIKNLEREVQLLKEELSLHKTLTNSQSVENGPLSEAQLAEISSHVQSYLNGTLEEIKVTCVMQVHAVFAQFKVAVNRMKGESSLSSGRRCDSSSRKLTSEREPESQEPDDQNQETQKSQSPEPVHPEIPPHISQAFEDFKVGQGSKLNSILKEHKAMLLERQSLFRQLTEELNAVKEEMDGVKHKQSLAQEDGHQFLEEPESSSVLRLSELKTLHQQKQVALCDLKAEVKYCGCLVHQTRERLASEFETWYKKPLPSSVTGTRAPSDNNELPPSTQSAQSFYNAQCWAQKRRAARAHSRKILPTLLATRETPSSAKQKKNGGSS